MKKNKCHFGKSIKSGLLLVVLLGGILNCVNGCNSNSNPDNVQELISSIKENLPIGTSFEAVESYLKKSEIEYSYDDTTKCLTGIVRDVGKKGFVATSISIIAEMDDQRKLKSLKTDIIYTGP